MSGTDLAAVIVAISSVAAVVLLVFVSYIGSLYKPIKSLSKLAQTISKGAAAAERAPAAVVRSRRR